MARAYFHPTKRAVLRMVSASLSFGAASISAAAMEQAAKQTAPPASRKAARDFCIGVGGDAEKLQYIDWEIGHPDVCIQDLWRIDTMYNESLMKAFGRINKLLGYQ